MNSTAIGIGIGIGVGQASSILICSSNVNSNSKRFLINTKRLQPLKSSSNSSSMMMMKMKKKKLLSRRITNTDVLFRVPHYPSNTNTATSPLMLTQDSTVKMEVDVPVSVAYNCYSDRESIPQWMPFISSVKVLPDKPDLSRWTLTYQAFGRDIQFSWLARNLQPIPNKKIHWRSLEGLPNSGAVRFFPKGPSSCLIELTVSYEVPQILAPVASALQPFLQSLLLNGLEMFSKFAKSRQADITS